MIRNVLRESRQQIVYEEKSKEKKEEKNTTQRVVFGFFLIDWGVCTLTESLTKKYIFILFVIYLRELRFYVLTSIRCFLDMRATRFLHLRSLLQTRTQCRGLLAY